jgi:uncharacterized protein (TIGR02466 family)
MVIEDFFPIPVSEVNLYKTLNEDELRVINSEKRHTIKNHGNLTSQNQFVLDRVELQHLKQNITNQINDFFKKVFEPTSDIQLYITNSWLNWTENNDYHHLHYHPNSLISGVFYVDSDDGDSISFMNPNNFLGNLKVKSPETGKWASLYWHCPIRKGNMVMFPSTLKHEVVNRPNTCKRTRISLAFNTWFKGTMGDSTTSNSLTI